MNTTQQLAEKYAAQFCIYTKQEDSTQENLTTLFESFARDLLAQKPIPAAAHEDERRLEVERLLAFVIDHQGTIEAGDAHLSIELNAPDGTWADFSIHCEGGTKPEIGDFKFIANELIERCDKIRAAMRDGKERA